MRDHFRKEKPDSQPSEQDGMNRLFVEDKEAFARTVRVPQQKLNAFPPEIPCYEGGPGSVGQGKWSRGDFILHFAGAWAYLDKEEDPTGVLMNNYQGKIVHEGDVFGG